MKYFTAEVKPWFIICAFEKTYFDEILINDFGQVYPNVKSFELTV